MGSSFNYVIVPKKIQSRKDLKKFYLDTQQKLFEKYGEDFEGYSGDMAVDNGELEIKEDLKLDLTRLGIPKYKKVLTKNSFNEDYSVVEKMMDLVNGHVEKWGPSIAIRVNDQWVICGSYSD
jgi:translation initiation factor 2 alpha subunit (eIF-2alpha)